MEENLGMGPYVADVGGQGVTSDPPTNVWRVWFLDDESAEAKPNEAASGFLDRPLLPYSTEFGPTCLSKSRTNTVVDVSKRVPGISQCLTEVWPPAWTAKSTPTPS
jgi:hypothetical protein